MVVVVSAALAGKLTINKVGAGAKLAVDQRDLAEGRGIDRLLELG